MPARRRPPKGRGKPPPKRQPAHPSGQVRTTVSVDPAKLAKARQLLQLNDDGAVLRRALDYLIDHHPPTFHEEE